MDGLTYSDEAVAYGAGHEHSPSALQAAASDFGFRARPTDLTGFLSAAVGHHPMMRDDVHFHPDESDDDDDLSERSDDDDDDRQSDGDESSIGELDE